MRSSFCSLVIGYFKRTRPCEPDETLPDHQALPPGIGNGRWLHLSERIFDPSDARWLAEELAFPKLAEALVLGRKLLAIHWLEALQESFHEWCERLNVTADELPEVGPEGSWRILWLTLRFKLLVSYALIVVKLFGPYHALIPSFSWSPFSRWSERGFRRAAMAPSRIPAESCLRYSDLEQASFCMRHSWGAWWFHHDRSLLALFVLQF